MILRLLKKIDQHFIKASWSDKLLWFSALRWALVVRFCMLFVPFRFYRQWLGKMHTVAQQQLSPQQEQQALHIKRIALAVCRYTPWESKCLVQAVTCRQLLLKKGIHTTLFLGIKTSDTAKMEAHAWLKLNDRILTGGKGHRLFKVVNYYG